VESSGFQVPRQSSNKIGSPTTGSLVLRGGHGDVQWIIIHLDLHRIDFNLNQPRSVHVCSGHGMSVPLSSTACRLLQASLRASLITSLPSICTLRECDSLLYFPTKCNSSIYYRSQAVSGGLKFQRPGSNNEEQIHHDAADVRDEKCPACYRQRKLRMITNGHFGRLDFQHRTYVALGCVLCSAVVDIKLGRSRLRLYTSTLLWHVELT
jgi:hypothetical protein